MVKIHVCLSIQFRLQPITIFLHMNASVFPENSFQRAAACNALCGEDDYIDELPALVRSRSNPYSGGYGNGYTYGGVNIPSDKIARLAGRAARAPRPPVPCTNPVGCQTNGHIKEWVLSWFRPTPQYIPPSPPKELYRHRYYK